MSTNLANLSVSEDEASSYIIGWLRSKPSASGWAQYGYEIYLPNLMRSFVVQRLACQEHEADRHLGGVSPPFYAAAWELCRRGILRPGIRRYREQSTEEGNAGNGYSVTPRGHKWVSEAKDGECTPAEVGQIAAILAKSERLFDRDYHFRAKEAVRCYRANCFLACCAMCGAAAESILVAACVAKSSDREAIIKEYSAAGGRGRMENRLVGSKGKVIQESLRAYLGLLKYWRDASAHYDTVEITEDEAFVALLTLMRLSIFVTDNWDTLIHD